MVLILVFLELTLRGNNGYCLHLRTRGLNPCYSGTYTMSAQMCLGKCKIRGVLILVILELTL